MKELKDLKAFQRFVLLACCNANKWSLKSHVPIQAINRNLNRKYHQYTRKSIKILVSNGFIIKHPTRGEITYGLSRKGLNAGLELEKEDRNSN